VHCSAECITDRTFVTFLLGLTGNIACGKSTVGQLLAERYGAEYVDADRLVHALYAAETPETAAIAARFGTDLVSSDGTIDRRRLGDRVLSDAEALRDLERILHPGVRRAIERRIAETPAPVLVVDAIRLIEAGMADSCDAVWVVTCSAELQLERLRASRGLTSEQAQLRIAAQPPQEEKVRRATSVLQNTGSLDELEQQLEAAWRRDIAPQLAQSSPP
jgi:dephospho-CoA kinase